MTNGILGFLTHRDFQSWVPKMIQSGGVRRCSRGIKSTASDQLTTPSGFHPYLKLMSIVKGIALITGSAQGIGHSIALRLARDGFDIALNDVPSKRDQLRVVANDIEKIGRRTHLVPADVAIEGEVKGMVQDVSKVLGGLDVVSKCRTPIIHVPGFKEYILRRW
jgi:hypothetical protein